MTDMPVSSAITRLCDPVDISDHRNNTAISAATETKAGAFNVWGNSFAAEYLPTGESLVQVAGVPFRFPPVWCAGMRHSPGPGRDPRRGGRCGRLHRR